MSGLGDFFKEMQRNKEGEEGEAEAEGEAEEGNSNGDESQKGKDAINEMFEEFEKHMNDSTDSEGKMPDMPNPEDIHNHLKGLFGGKLGSLAEELMEELTDDLQETLGLKPDEFNDSANPADVLKKLMRHPDKLMKLVQKIQGKFQEKMNSGDLSQEDIMKEAGEMLKKMKEMGGNSKQMNEMFQNMAKSMGGNMGGNMGKNMKVDTNRLDRMMRAQDTKDRIRAKLEKKKQENFILEKTNDPNQMVYRPLDGEKAEKSTLTDEQIQKIADDIGDLSTQNAPNKKKKKKNKNKK
jgi:hypothetical protein